MYNMYNKEISEIYADIAKSRRPIRQLPKRALFEAIASQVDAVQIFLSHKSCDKDKVKSIAEYLEERRVRYYLDADDPNLQKAFSENDDELTTHFIEVGINLSSHIMPCLSEQTKESWWVPYEIGYGKSREKEIATLFLRDVSVIPEYLKITRQLKTRKQFEEYIDEVASPRKLVTETFATYNMLNKNQLASSLKLAGVLK